MEPTVLDHVLFAVLVAVPPTLGRWSYFRLKRAVADGVVGVRLRYYRRVIAVQWLIAGVVVALWLVTGRPLATLGLLPWRGALPAAIGSGVAALAAAALLLQHRAVVRDAESMAGARRQIEPLMDLLPHDAVEDRWFARLSVSAGICEEIAERGFLIAYLSVWLGLWPAALVSAVVFGVSHAYQGVGGMVRTGAVGLVAAVLYVGSGWLLPAIVLHAAIDVGSARVVRAVRPSNDAAGSGAGVV